MSQWPLVELSFLLDFPESKLVDGRPTTAQGFMIGLVVGAMYFKQFVGGTKYGFKYDRGM